jgi:ribosomal protein S18 acetylase RimI-like enzyme
MCIEAFFNDGAALSGACGASKTQRKASTFPFAKNYPLGLPFSFFSQKSFAAATAQKSPTKSLQLAYLRNLQSGDLKRRREREAESNMMFVARRLVPIVASSRGDWVNGAKAEEERRGREFPSSALAYLSSPLVLDLSHAYNLPHASDESASAIDYVRGEILGFVEVTNRPFGLGMPTATNANGYATLANGDAHWNRKRPVLTNLSVRREARQLGVGSKLLELCEQHVVTEWGENEVVLEVEDDNDRAKDFYLKRGYQILFTDGTARRYDLSGLWIREVRCQRLIMRKQFSVESPAEAAVQSTVNFGIKVLQAIKDNMFSSVA